MSFTGAFAAEWKSIETAPGSLPPRGPRARTRIESPSQTVAELASRANSDFV